ncbi:ABC transporter substrate-binding protein [Paenibacillus turpanensis]|uniref:ABC transporter substrate-binding protein n=1 Tax=Paenibacillus turpanensis TaxID=2689078 RepID=UPI001FB82D5E|nr:iron-siderophore ABC transporter substrate-binding protein [Paenibacillus turpanensis]
MMLVRSKWCLQLTALLLLIMLASGCGAGQNVQTNAQEGQSSSKESAEAATEAVRVIKHAMGTTEVKGTPQKVVTLYQGATDAVVQLGVKPVGAVEAWIEKPWYLYIRDKMDGVTNVGSETQPNLEEIIALKPDLIIGTKTRHEKIYEQLSAIAPTVIEEDHYHWKTTLHLSAEALNKVKEEKDFLAEWDKKVAGIKEKLGAESKAKVAIVDFRADHARLFYNTFPNLVLQEVGFSFPGKEGGSDFAKLTTKESIPQMNADLIFDMTSMDRDDGRVETRKEWTSHPLWSNLDAVKNNKVFPVNPATWTNGSGPKAAMIMLDDITTLFELK